jgi:large subunit ribosomal protein L10
MPKNRTQKDELLHKYKDLIKNKSGYLLVNSDKINTTTITTLKIQLKNVGANFTILKNNIFKVALQDSKQPLQVQDFDGPTALIVFDEDPTKPAKLVKEVQKETNLLDSKLGVFEGEFLTAERVMQLAEIPSREILLSQLVGTMNAPLSNFMNTVTGNIKGLTMILKGISEKKS